MKTLLLTILIASTLCANAQSRSFKDGNDFGRWTMNYYRNPEPAALFDAFNYACQSREVAQAGSRTIMLSFFASILRTDTIGQENFFNRLRTTTDTNLVYGFAYLLSFINTEFSLKTLEKFKNLEQLSKYEKEFDALLNQNPLNIYEDPITQAIHLDMLWADFFATGSTTSVERIITKLSDIKSDNAVDKIVAGSARWSLTSNSIHHERVFQTCEKQREETEDIKIRKSLDEILKEAKKRKQSPR
jgi:hypothetical protein